LLLFKKSVQFILRSLNKTQANVIRKNGRTPWSITLVKLLLPSKTRP